MNMNKRTKSIIVTAIILAFPAIAIACDGTHAKSASCPAAGKHGASHTHHAVPGKSPDHIRAILKGADRIGLSEKQRQQVGVLLIEAESAVAKAHAEAEVTVAAFRSRLHSGSVSDKEVNSYSKKMGELRAATLAANLKASVAASRLLSDEQRAKLYAENGHRDGAK